MQERLYSFLKTVDEISVNRTSLVSSDNMTQGKKKERRLKRDPKEELMKMYRKALLQTMISELFCLFL